MRSDTKYACLFVLIFLVIVFVGYRLTAQIYDGVYMVLFEMDDKKISHTQTEEQFDKARATGVLAMAAGVFTGRYTMAGLGLDNFSRNSMVTEFAQVKCIVPKRKYGTICLDSRFGRNHVYVSDDDFDPVYDYLVSHCKAEGVKIGDI